MHLYLIRHGQSHVNLKDWEGGNTDEGLTELGQQQATALAAWLPTQVPEIDVLYASTMRRATETAEFVARAYQCDIQPDHRLRELGNNRADHSPWPSKDLPEYSADYWASERPFSAITPPLDASETLMHFRTRVGSFIEEKIGQHPEDVLVVVCHGGVIDMAFDHAFNVGPWRRCEVWNHNTGVTYLQHVAHPRREVWRLRYHNRIDHLSQE
jgi:probable phosphoglycerate mutase